CTAPAHPGSPTRSLSRSAGEADRPQGQSRYDCAAGLSTLFGVTRRRGGHCQRGGVYGLSLITGIVVYKRRRYGPLSDITEARSARRPDRRVTTREKRFHTKG